MLQLANLAPDLERLRDSAPAAAAARAAQLASLRAAYQQAGAQHAQLLERAARDRRTITWRLGLPLAPLGPGVTVDPATGPYAVAAADGSNLDLDPHLNPDYYALNVSEVRLVYGPGSSASIVSTPQLRGDPADLVVGSGGDQRRKVATDIALERDLLEVEALVRATAALPADRPRLALLDGTLLHWDLEQTEPAVREDFLARYAAALVELRRLGVPVAGYIAAPQSHDLVSLLRVQLCRFEQTKCAGCDARYCQQAAGLTDAALLHGLLQPGERGPILRVASRQQERTHQLDVLACYVRLEDAVVRVELPAWVHDDGLLDQVLGVLLDQVRKGAGYPPALQEAHEAAVITTSDRGALRDWVEQVTGRRGSSAKASSKRLKRI